MKTILMLIATLLCSCNYTTMSGDVAEDMNAEGSWAYLALSKGNRCIIADSALIRNGKFNMRFKINEPWDAELFIKNVEVPYYWLIFSPGDKMHINLTKNEMLFQGTGAPCNDNLYYYLKKNRTIATDYIVPIQDSIIQCAADDTITRKQLVNRLNYYIQARRQSMTDLILSMDNAYFATSFLRVFHNSHYQASESLLDSLTDILIKRFPKDPDIISLTDKDYKTPPSTEEDLANLKAWDRIRNKKTPLPQAEKNDSSQTLLVTPYVMDDIVADFELPNADGDLIALSNISRPYVLIDFWATWCGPCCREVPNLIKIQDKYKKSLKIFAVSIDEDTSAWKKYIEINNMKGFANVQLVPENGNFHDIMGKFNVKTIPHNFLLDKDRRIIAIDLRGEALEQKMKELTGK